MGRLLGINARGEGRPCSGDALDIVFLLMDYASRRSGASSRCCPAHVAMARSAFRATSHPPETPKRISAQ